MSALVPTFLCLVSGLLGANRLAARQPAGIVPLAPPLTSPRTIALSLGIARDSGLPAAANDAGTMLALPIGSPGASRTLMLAMAGRIITIDRRTVYHHDLVSDCRGTAVP